MGAGAQPTVAVYKLLSLVRIFHTHARNIAYIQIQERERG